MSLLRVAISVMHITSMLSPSGHDAWLPSVSSQVRVSAGSSSRLAWSLYKGAALWRAVYGPSATGKPIRTIREEKGISSRFQVSISSQ